ncbi:MAG: tRNA (adenosine(37)-N6)-dimethylallyltransferase MiaA [Eudoraea sp.]|nr:tRNA (adenosine(37)-N6)-dimethylallyltransferase MiaA [Eudoraea sp.]
MAHKVLISIVGPTAIGKTQLSIALAKHFKTHIISADSRQFYKEMNIGTAVPSKSELSSVPHHFIQHKSIQDTYTVGDFERDALEELEKLFTKTDIVVMVGGSGLYADAVTTGLDHFPKVDHYIRESLNEQFRNEGIEVLQEQLRDLDPDYYNQVDLQNPHRLIRALEVCLASGSPYSSFLKKPRTQRPFKCITVGLTADREIIYNRINSRVDQMMARGLLEEVSSLADHKDKNALQTVGYRELFRYLEGEFDLDTAIKEIKKNSRRFAKRQLTWFKKNSETIWTDYQEDLNIVISKIENRLKNSYNEQ